MKMAPITEFTDTSASTLGLVIVQLLRLVLEQSCKPTENQLDTKECRLKFLDGFQNQLSEIPSDDYDDLKRSKRESKNSSINDEVVLAANVRLLLYCGPKKGEEKQVLEGPCRDSFFHNLGLEMQRTIYNLHSFMRKKRFQKFTLEEAEARKKTALDTDFLRLMNNNSLSYCKIELHTKGEALIPECVSSFLTQLNELMKNSFASDVRILPAYEELNSKFVKTLNQKQASEHPEKPLEENIFTNLTSEEREAKLNEAAEKGDLSTVSSLLALRTEPQQALKTAMVSKQNSVVKKLIEAGANANAQYDRDFRPLHFAVTARNVEAARMLLSAYADVNAKTSSGQTPLHLAVIQNNREMCQILLDKGADVNAQDNLGNTVVMTAVQVGQLPLVKFITRNGFEPWYTNKEGKTAYQIAVSLGKHGIAQDLLQHEQIQRPIRVNYKPFETTTTTNSREPERKG